MESLKRSSIVILIAFILPRSVSAPRRWNLYKEMKQKREEDRCAIRGDHQPKWGPSKLLADDVWNENN
ncbi:hypothetical protein BgiMline_029893 [Biomphalaria glabrata]|nr:hypothetical protein BgiMline_026613 [Biomphalaria glabrata]KAI8796181.1 hypothetical protein BgiBS90_003948 [Biomphalaria glabrata]